MLLISALCWRLREWQYVEQQEAIGGFSPCTVMMSTVVISSLLSKCSVGPKEDIEMFCL